MNQNQINAFVDLRMGALGGRECKHPRLALPKFDEKAAESMSAMDVRSRFPRGYSECPDCRSNVISYASFAHFCAGDW